MWNKIRDFIFAIFIILIFVLSLYESLAFIFSLQKEIAAVIVAGMITIFGSVISYLIARHMERARDAERDIRQRKVPIYEQFVKFLALKYLMSTDGSGGAEKSAETTDFLRRFSVDITIWGSDDVVREWIKFKTLAMKFALVAGEGLPERDTEANIVQRAIIPIGNLLLAIRKDIGHSNKKLSNLDIMRLFYYDLDEVLAKTSRQSSK